MSTKDLNDQAAAELDRPITEWLDQAEMDSAPRKITIVHSARMPAELSARLEAEAERRGINPSKLICELVEEGLAKAEESPLVTVRMADLHRAIDACARRAA